MGIQDSDDLASVNSKDASDAVKHGCCHALLRYLACRTEKVQPQQQEDDGAGSDEEANDDGYGCCSCLLRRPSEEELKDLSARYCEKSLNWM